MGARRKAPQPELSSLLACPDQVRIEVRRQICQATVRVPTNQGTERQLRTPKLDNFACSHPLAPQLSDLIPKRCVSYCYGGHGVVGDQEKHGTVAP